LGLCFAVGIWQRGSGPLWWAKISSLVCSIHTCFCLFEFTLGWVYVFDVGVLGGTVLRHYAGEAAHVSSTVEWGARARADSGLSDAP